MDYRTIVVGWDETEEGGRALERAAALARAFGAQLVCVQVVPAAFVPAAIPAVDPMLLSPRVLAPEEPGEQQERRAALQGLLERLEVQADVVAVEGDEAHAILEVAGDRGADLVVVGSPEAGFTDRLLGLDVGAAVERHAHCDVLVVR